MLYRSSLEVSNCQCITAWSACLEVLPEEDIDFPWGPNQTTSKQQTEADVVDENYLTWSVDCGKHAQVDMLKPSAAHMLHNCGWYNCMLDGRQHNHSACNICTSHGLTNLPSSS